jgi:outer membrane immunogenic protein
MKSWNLFALLLSGLLLLTGPSFASTEEMAAVLRRLDALEQSNASIKQQNALLQQQNALLQDRMRRLESKDGLAVAAIPVSASSNAEPQQMAALSYATPARTSYDRPKVLDWSGPHVGIFSGYALGKWNGDATDYPHQPMNGWFGGVLAGYDMQLPNNWVAGIEADISLTDIKQTDNYIDGAFTLRLDYLATLRGRLGYAVNRTLFYATGGLAVAHIDFTGNQYHPGGPLSPPFQTTANNTHFGYAIGGGVQWAMFDNMSFKAEYLWVDLPDKTYMPTVAPGGPTNSIRAGWSGNTVKAGFNWQFN